jgi:hypothetical protein
VSKPGERTADVDPPGGFTDRPVVEERALASVSKPSGMGADVSHRRFRDVAQRLLLNHR